MVSATSLSVPLPLVQSSLAPSQYTCLAHRTHSHNMILFSALSQYILLVVSYYEIEMSVVKREQKRRSHTSKFVSLWFYESVVCNFTLRCENLIDSIKPKYLQLSLSINMPSRSNFIIKLFSHPSFKQRVVRRVLEIKNIKTIWSFYLKEKKNHNTLFGKFSLQYKW